MELAARGNGLAELAAIVRGLCAPAAISVPFVRWLERARAGAVLCGAPLDVSRTLREELFSSGIVAVLTSATLGPGDDPGFGWFRGQLGLDGALARSVDTLRVGSPFDYRRAVELIVEEGMPDPGAMAASYRDEAASRTLAHVLQNGGRALVLCTSWEFVRGIAARLREPLQERGIALLVQGEAPLARLLQHKRDDPTSVLVGTDSLWEGIDVRGDALTLVVVTRLPFQSPGHPLTKARLDAIAARGGDPFLDWSLPEAILKFRQGFGRLIRSQTDRGKVVILDPRARTRRYGRRFLGALPPGVGEERGDAPAGEPYGAGEPPAE
jgi:ATP-dependent DNA helicase DinG